MFKISNTQKAVLDLLGERHEVEIHCNPGQGRNTISVELAGQFDFPVTTPRLVVTEDSTTPISNVEFTLEITSLNGEVKRITGVADVANHLRKDSLAIRLGYNTLKELGACIVM